MYIFFSSNTSLIFALYIVLIVLHGIKYNIEGCNHIMRRLVRVYIQRTLVITTVFVTEDFAFKLNLLL